MAKPSVFEKIITFPLIEMLISLIVYAVYGIILGACLVPSFILGRGGFQLLIKPLSEIWSLLALRNIAFFCGIIGGAVFLYFITGLMVMGILIRLISAGIKPGRYPVNSFTCARWLFYSGIFTIVYRTILPVTTMTFFATLFFRILGCKMGKNVYINTPNLNDPKFLTIGDNVMIGNRTDISCHIFENNHLLLGPITIGNNVQIGTRSYIMPNVRIGDNVTIGINCIIRKNTEIPSGSRLSSPGALTVRGVIRLEKEYGNKS